MQLSNYIDLITRLEYALNSEEQDSLFNILDQLDELPAQRQETIAEYLFWEQFGLQWNLKNTRNAFNKAFVDMAIDTDIRAFSRRSALPRSCDFAKVVDADVKQFRKFILSLLTKAAPNLKEDVFDRRQALIQKDYTRYEDIDDFYIEEYEDVIDERNDTKKRKMPKDNKEQKPAQNEAGVRSLSIDDIIDIINSHEKRRWSHKDIL